MSNGKLDRSKEPIDWDTKEQKAVAGTRPDAKYGAVSESLRHTIPQSTACSLFCGGRKCKYCTASHWRDDQMTVTGLFSHWVTDNILAMARPTNEGNDKYNFIDQFIHLGIKSIINLQTTGEHSSCGPPLDPSGFSYNPQQYMDEDIFFYNFAWPDYDVGSLSNVLDMVKVMQFALSEGKVSVHCHAGLGRTGVLIAAYLVFANRMDPHEAVHYMRSKRPGAIQTRTQVGCIEEFALYLKPFRVVFSDMSSHSYDFTLGQYLIRQRHILHGFESRQLKNIPKLLYVVGERLLELADKSNCKLPLVRSPTFKVQTDADCSLPGALSGSDHDLTMCRSSSTINSLNGNHFNSNQLAPVTNGKPSRARSMTDLNTNGFAMGTLGPKRGNGSPVMSRRTLPPLPNINQRRVVPDMDMDSIGRPSSQFFLGSDPDLRYRPLAPPGPADTPADLVAVLMGHTEYPPDLKEQVESFKSLLNEDASTWLSLQDETDGLVLSKLMWDWLDHLKEPVLSMQDMPDLLNHSDEPLIALAKLDKGARGTVEYLFGVVARLAPLQEKIEFELVQRMLSILSHQNVTMDSDLPLGATGVSVLRRTSNLGEMTSSLAMRLIQFAYNLIYVLRSSLTEQQEKEEREEEERRTRAEQAEDRDRRPSKRGSKKKSSKT